MRGRPREFDRDAVLEKAMGLFWQRGYEATSIAELVEAVGIGRQSLYGAFGDKRRLFEEAFELYARTEFEPFLDIIQAPGSAADNIRGWLDHIRDLAARQPQQGCMVVRTASQCCSDPELASLSGAQIERLEDAVTATIERAMEEGEAPSGRDARALARTALSACYGMGAVAAIMPDAQSMAEGVLRTLETMILGSFEEPKKTS